MGGWISIIFGIINFPGKKEGSEMFEIKKVSWIGARASDDRVEEELIASQLVKLGSNGARGMDGRSQPKA